MKGWVLVLFILLVEFGLTPNSVADPVYRVESTNGSISYTSKPPKPGAQPAKLPEIMKGEFKIEDSLKKSCDKHGSIDCTQGPDADGSVICTDGFKDAAARFLFMCSAPKLIISDILDPSPKGELKIFVRNLKSVRAEKPTLLLKLADERVIIPGPSEIEPFGIAEFAVTLDESRKLKGKPKESELVLDCANCG